MQPLLLLHGAIGASAQLTPLANKLSAYYNVYSLNFSGHGGAPGNDTPFSMPAFAAEVLAFMAAQGLDKVSVFGYSMGGYVAMYLAKHHPGKVDKIVTLATKYHWDEATAAKEVQMLDPDKIEQKVPAFADAQLKMHLPNDWKALMRKTAAMMLDLGKDNPMKTEDYAAIVAPAMLLLGDRDKMVTLDETLVVYRALPNARMGIMPGTPHPIEQVNTDMLAFFIKDFIR